MNIPSKRCLGMALIMAVTFSQAQITTADNGLTASGTAPNKNVSLGGTLNNAATSIDFGNSNTSSNFLFKKGTSNYFFIGNDGNIGIGNNSPAQKLDVTGMIQSTTGFKYGSTIGASLETYFAYSRLITNTTTDGLMFWTSKNPSSIKFVINDAQRGLMLDGNTSNLLFLNSDGNSLGGIGSANGTGHLAFLYSTAPGSHIEGARLTNTGNVGIGTSAPTAKLEVSNGTNSIKIDPTNSLLNISGPVSNTILAPKIALGFNGDGNLPLHLQAYSHDNIALAFDSYATGGTWNSSHSGSNFALYKANNELIIGFNSGTAAGATFGSFNLTNGVRFSNDGKLGIGGAAGSAKLYVNGLSGFGTSSPDQLLTVNASTGANSLVSFKQNSTTAAYVGLGTDGIFRNQTLSGTELQLRADGASNFVSLYTNTTEKMRVTASGNIGIGTSSPNSNAKLDVAGNIFSSGKIAIGTTDMAKISTYSLAVNGDALFNKVKVKLYASWPDYVFQKNYNLLPLSEIERFIQQNNHLPEVPSSAEVEKAGLDIGENQVLLLKKIEELTLYAIDQNKKIEEQGKKIEEQGKKIEKMEEQMKKK